MQNSVVFYRETFGSDAWAAQQLCHEDADACIAEIDDLMDAFDTPELRAFESDFESYCGSIKTVGELKAIDKDDQEFIDLIAQTPY